MLSEAVANVQPDCPVVRVQFRSPLHSLLADLAKDILPREERTAKQTSLHLKGLLWKALEGMPRILVTGRRRALKLPSRPLSPKNFSCAGNGRPGFSARPRGHGIYG